MDKYMDRLTSAPYVSAMIARRRLFFGISIVFLILIALSVTETDDVNSWSRANGGGFSHITASNGSVVLTNGSGVVVPNQGIINTGPGHKRPGYELALANGIPFRIMALGASTTRGDEGHDNNGFRRPVRDWLVSIGNPVNFVGTQRIGNMSDNDIEAYPGARTGQIHGHAEKIVPKTKPNLFLVNAGSNDCFQNFDIPNFYKRYYNFIEYLLAASPRATVVMGTLLPTTETQRWNASERVTEVNQQLRRLHKIFEQEGKPVVLAEMYGPDGIQPENLAKDLMHPNDAGYEMMGRIIKHAIIEADAKGFLRPAEMVHGIIQDGDLERQNEEYGAWLENKKKAEAEHKRNEEQALKDMRNELDKFMEELEVKKHQKQQNNGERRLRRSSGDIELAPLTPLE